MYAYAIEATHLRNPRVEMTGVFTDSAMTLIEDAARTILMASSEGDSLRTNLAVLRRLISAKGSTRSSLVAASRGDCWRRNDTFSRSGPCRLAGFRQVFLGAQARRRRAIK